MKPLCPLYQFVYVVNPADAPRRVGALMALFPEPIDELRAFGEIAAMLEQEYEGRAVVSHCWARDLALISILPLFNWRWAPRCSTYPESVVMLGAPRDGGAAVRAYVL